MQSNRDRGKACQRESEWFETPALNKHRFPDGPPVVSKMRRNSFPSGVASIAGRPYFRLVSTHGTVGAEKSPMHDQYLDLDAAKLAVAAWITGLEDEGRCLPSSVTKRLREQLDRALPFLDSDGVPCLELPELASLGQGIFRCSFRVHGTLIRIAPYAPAEPTRPVPPRFPLGQLMPLATPQPDGPAPLQAGRPVGRT